MILGKDAPVVVVEARYCRALTKLLEEPLARFQRDGVRWPPEFIRLVEELRQAGASSHPGTAGTAIKTPPATIASDTLTASEVAQRTGIGRRAVTKAAKDGRLFGQLVRGAWTFEVDDVEEFRRRREERDGQAV